MVVMKSDPYDCGAGFNNWEAGWSTSKKEWCCINKGLGCQGDAKESWTVCDGDDNCGSNSFLQKWDRSPRELASEVDGGLASVPGIPQQVWGPVVERWQQNAPHFGGRAVWLEDIAAFVKQLLADDPFGTGDSVPYVDFWAPGDGKVVAVTQRQLAFVVANVIMGNTIPAGDGLSAAVQRCAEGPEPPDMVLSLLSMLAVLSQELRPGQAGTTLVGTAPAVGDLSWKDRLGNQTLKEPRLQLQIGDKRTGGLGDFMSGGVPFQALTDIAGNVVGGGAQLCATANSQDESLVQFYSEVLAFAFWTSEGRMLPVPWTLMGARRYLSEIGGESSAREPFFNTCGKIHEEDWLNQDIPSTATSVKLGGKSVRVMASTFVALKSVATPGLGGDCSVGEAMNHNCEAQRNHLDEDVSMWYQAYEATMYPAPVRDAFRTLVQHVGTGPWGAGVWFGDSQVYFLTVWLATSLLGGASLDYYLYDHFCENPANQCFLLGEAGCGDCISTSAVDGAPIDAGRCGSQSLWGVIDHFKGMPVQDLYQALKDVGGPPTQVFDLLAPGTMAAPADVPNDDDLAASRGAAPPAWGSSAGAAAAESPRELIVHLSDSAEPIVATTAEPAADKPAADKPASAKRYSFAGYYAAGDVRGACAESAVAMPKTAEEQTALEDAVRRAIEAGDMAGAWPRNTIWLGGRWSGDRWEWDDGEEASRLDWAESQPSGTADQQEEPYLCLVADGRVHDSSAGSPLYKFGVMCQESAGEEASEGPGPLLKVDFFPVPPVDDGFEAACLGGNGLDDGWEYVFNAGRGTRGAACGEAADYWCCKRRAPAGRTSSTSAAADFWQQILTR